MKYHNRYHNKHQNQNKYFKAISLATIFLTLTIAFIDPPNAYAKQYDVKHDIKHNPTYNTYHNAKPTNISYSQSERPIPDQGIFYEQYFSIYLGNIKCGCSRFQSERKANQIISRSKMILKLGRQNFNFRCEVFTKATETITGKPIEYKTSTSLGNFKSQYDCKFTDKQLIVKITQNGQSSIRKFPKPNVKLAWAAHLETLKFLKQYGATFKLNTYDPQINPARPTVINYHIIGPAKITFANRIFSGIKIITKIQSLPIAPSTSIVDTQNNPIYTEMTIGAFKLKMIATNKSDAISGLITKEIFSQSLIKLDKPLKIVNGCLFLKITSNDNSAIPPLTETSMQKIIASSQNWQILKICSYSENQKNSKNKKHTTAYKKNTINTKKYLANSSYVNLKDPLLIKLAKQATQNTTNPYAKIRKLCMFVHNYITKKNLSSIFDNAAHIARTKTGDCSEHSVLLAALARIENIPSRIVTGLAYTPTIGKFGAFGYHMWVQVWIDGNWIDIDPTFGQIHPDPTHIAIAFSDLADGSLTTNNAKLAEYIGRIKIEVWDKNNG